MQDFLFLFRNSADPRNVNLSPEAMQKGLHKWVAWVGELAKSGNFKAGEPLSVDGRQVVGKDRRLVDGPFTEAKDLVGGFVIVHAKDLDHATELARGCPVLDFGGNVEIRAIQERKM
jgi:hypothetical protein